MLKRFLTFLLVFGCSAALALPRTDPVPGGVMVLPLDVKSEQRPQVTFRDAPTPVVRDETGGWKAIIGIPLSITAGQHSAELVNGTDKTALNFQIEDKAYKTQRLTIKNKRKVEPNQEDLDRIWKEKKRKTAAKKSWRETIPDFDFIIPVEGITSSPFGLRRYFNDKPRRPHSGLDIAAAKGTPIRAPADATVVLVDDFFFSGNVIYLDHGQGVITYYAHMSEHKVKEGQKVAKGEVIGLVGMTGRVTGPHLHWGVYLNRTPVNPLLFLAEKSE
jgi:murein DD-endopeptidase MepM/ murein hydrolase activator NlpD